jgi:DNA repair exonuclease SbcCD ATPase subunit
LIYLQQTYVSIERKVKDQ